MELQPVTERKEAPTEFTKPWPLTKGTQVHQLTALVKEIIDDLKMGIELTTHNNDWHMHLKRGNIVRHVVGYRFPINNSTADELCRDKPAAAAIFKQEGIPHICHHIFVNPAKGEWAPREGEWMNIHTYAKRHNYDVVVKPKDGTGGIGVSHIKTKTGRDLELLLAPLFLQNDVAMCAFKRIDFEYRVVMLNHQAQLIFKKEPPFVVGDGTKTLPELTQAFLKTLDERRAKIIAANIDPSLWVSKVVPKANEKVYIHWKHNLGQGATCDIMGGEVYMDVTKDKGTDLELQEKLAALAKRATQALDINFCSVDIVKVVDENNPKKPLRVLEVNSGVMMENLMSQYGETGRQIARSIYTKAIKQMFPE